MDIFSKTNCYVHKPIKQIFSWQGAEWFLAMASPQWCSCTHSRRSSRTRSQVWLNMAKIEGMMTWNNTIFYGNIWIWYGHMMINDRIWGLFLFNSTKPWHGLSMAFPHPAKKSRVIGRWSNPAFVQPKKTWTCANHQHLAKSWWVCRSHLCFRRPNMSGYVIKSLHHMPSSAWTNPVRI